jgi:hypothetical protein
VDVWPSAEIDTVREAASVPRGITVPALDAGSVIGLWLGERVRAALGRSCPQISRGSISRLIRSEQRTDVSGSAVLDGPSSGDPESSIGRLEEPKLGSHALVKSA